MRLDNRQVRRAARPFESMPLTAMWLPLASPRNGDAKPHFVSCGLGGEERIERLFEVAIEDTRSIIEDTDTDRLTVDYLSCMIGHGTT